MDRQAESGVKVREFELEQFESDLRKLWVKIAALKEIPSFQVTVFENLASTNQKVWEWLEAGAGQGRVAIALEQTAGRGQWGRQWQSPPGGLYLSLALKPNLTPEQGTQLTMAIAWGVAEALRQQAVPVLLKWLNDLVIEDQKLGGVLVETRMRQERIVQAVVGIGINWRNPVPEVGVSLFEVMNQRGLHTIPSLERLAAVVLQGAMGGYRWLQESGIEALLPHYEAILSHLGRVIPLEAAMGRVVGVTPKGCLRVRLPSIPGGSERFAEDLLLKPGSIQLGYGERRP